MKSLNDLLTSIIVAVLAWLAYNYLGAIWALVVLIAATIAFVLWNSRRGRDKR